MGANFERAEIGSICLCQETEDGRIVQIAMTSEQHKVLQAFLSALSKESPLVKMGEEYDLMLKRECNSNKKGK